MRPQVLTLAVVLAAVAATGGSTVTAPTPPADTGYFAEPRLADPHPCAGQPGFTCSTLTVPLDYGGQIPGALNLRIATADNAGAPRGVLLFLTGGPGQAGVPVITRLAKQRLPEVAANYRFVMLDQRGTGEFGAINCTGLQTQVGSSDIAAPAADAVTQCAAQLGNRAPFYSTDETVTDLDRLRQALGVEKMTVDGVSYGSLTAARYAVSHPRNVSKLVLDSVLPHHATASDSLYLNALRATARVLRDACGPGCESDPAEDLAWLVRHRDTTGGVRLFDLVVSYEYIDPRYRNLITALRVARAGDPTKLDGLLTNFMPGGDNVKQFSSGLHAATLCADQRFPWGDASTPFPSRLPMLKLAEARLPDTWPFTPEVAVNQGMLKTCQPWPAQRPASNPAGLLPDVPVLLLSGDRDLATPLEWAQQEASVAPQGELVVVKGEAHSIQNRELGHAGRDAVIEFLSR
ncbi:alpha/beta fold hydrolase [Amycolatopsis sp.]|jgi:pimeloyl-ACP methyl ester carboxylesterase|uniref:alpha/beta fold hydrolase n=1 Tax=Amycolatopsis sp. TaxID=37632 RepID=UPI002E029C44|nr:alpha/beta fold hydrolase [Amycolatopsis sp.]